MILFQPPSGLNGTLSLPWLLGVYIFKLLTIDFLQLGILKHLFLRGAPLDSHDFSLPGH